MPIHDWTRVGANRFADFHLTWLVALSDALNNGRLPLGYFAMIEPRTRVPEPDFISVDPAPQPGLKSLKDDWEFLEPMVHQVIRSDAVLYSRKADRITIRHPDGDAVALIEIVSPGNKANKHELDDFVNKSVNLLHAGIHLLFVDLFPPGRRDPQGIHKAMWDWVADEPFTLPPDKPLTLVSYTVGYELVGYIQPVAVGDVLPDMPIFLTADRYVPCPLQATYQTAWEQFPAPLKGPLE